MTTPPPPPGHPAHPGDPSDPSYPGSPPPGPTKPRPGRGWWLCAWLTLLLGIGGAVAAFWLTVARFTDVEARIAADGQSVAVPVEPGTEYLLWARSPAPRCELRDDAGPLEVSGLFGTSYQRNEWSGLGTVEPTSPTIDVVCEQAGGDLEIGVEPSISSFALGLLLGIGALLLAAGGAVWLIVLLVLRSRRPAR